MNESFSKTILDFVEEARDLSTWAACVNWRGGENQKEWLSDLKAKIESLQAAIPSVKALVREASVPPAWRDIDSAPKGKHVIVVSTRFPEPHEAMLYDDGWYTWGVNGAFRDDPHLWTEMPASPAETGQAKQAVIVVWDKEGKFFQNWTADYKNGDGIEHGKRIAAQMGGTYAITGGN